MIDHPYGLHGVFRRDDLVREMGLTAVRALLTTGQLTAFSRTILVDRRRALDFPTRAAAALSWAGDETVLTSHTSAWLHGCTAADQGTIHVLSSYDRRARKRPGIAFHNGSLDTIGIGRIHGLRVVDLAFAIAEILCAAPRATALACADQALAQASDQDRKGVHDAIGYRLDTRADSRGRWRAWALLDLATGRPESPAESALLLAVVDGGLPVPVAQHPILDIDGRERYRLDFGWPDPKIALEYDGYAAHEGRLQRDAARDLDLARRGWLVIRATAADLRDPSRFMSELRVAFAARRFACA
ncbi:Protein of unknown function [Actinokineospora alba]|uniref:DUF559 domain-containing protein n=1 Tax=Actinokineospora alba TaxID=504798 RepID=A0A1H0WFX8_9PSEU|nr:DUF559 domain-containing protein [Actinokineospora alba]TDP65301.1 uncharacterized protein DUF559 [Actinokineospora alba]SDH59191.1 Protein of unknown function [Actinokineospora alba]SDP89630.1 Protein of unknown function [Actinokineospora alba]